VTRDCAACRPSPHSRMQSPHSASVVGHHPLLAEADAAELRQRLSERVAAEVQWAHDQQEHMVCWTPWHTLKPTSNHI
jgi:hypothetical protein